MAVSKHPNNLKSCANYKFNIIYLILNLAGCFKTNLPAFGLPGLMLQKVYTNFAPP